MTGKVLMERYKLEEQIGEGGMASVYCALDLRTGHRVAVKFLRQEYQENPEFLDRFRREATAASRMSHHNIVNLLDIGDNPAHPYLVFEFVDGKTLKEIISEKGKLPQATAVQIAIRILSALRHAHEAGVIHRDIKPQNILVDRFGYIKVSDFGIARMVGSNTLTDAEGKLSVMGSVHYFSPEQARGETTTFASDLYSVGVVIYEMLTGKVPYEGETPISVAMQHMQGSAKPVRELADDVAPALEQVVLKAMQKDPKDRYSSAMLMAQALHEALLIKPGQTQDTPVFAPRGKTANRNTIHRKRRFRDRMLLLLLSLVLILGVFIGVYFLYRDIVNATRAPLLTGYTLERAIREAEQEGLIPLIIRASSSEAVDTVINQSRDVDTPMKRGDIILLTVSSGPARKPVPDVTGMQLDDAGFQLERIGLETMITKRAVNQAAPGTVLGQDPAAGFLMDAGGIIKLVISAGETAVPNVAGMMKSEAFSALKRARLQPGDVNEVAVEDPTQHGRIASQLPVAGDLVAEESGVDLVVYVPQSVTPTVSPAFSPAGT